MKYLVVLVVLLLDWLALDDITTGTEPNYWGEYTILIGSAIFFIALLIFRARGSKPS